ncbi:AraC family transcriptional regulator [Stenotrophomonas nematodicola]|uniref:Helix-turn-helix domain-containing protein n=1 Tax=Stenotrophomonas nematodicola TaxID=2656746 RepID=A0ABW7CY95_9GAMM
MANQTSSALIDPTLADAAHGPLLFAASNHPAVGPRRTPRHQHARGQLIGARQGLLQIEAGSAHWLLPAGHLAWIPPGLPHALLAPQGFDGWSLYFSAAASARLPGDPRVLFPGALLLAAITRALAWRPAALDAAQQRLAEVIVDELVASVPLPLALAQPRDRRLRQVARALAQQPHDGREVEAWAARIGVSARTLARRWQAETGMGLAQWRQRLRVLHALPQLLAGDSVTRTALGLGYDTTSAFIAVFKREMGTTPARYVRSRGATA